MNIFVGGSSREIAEEQYVEAATKVGQLIVKGNHNFIFGGCAKGLVGKVYSEVIKTRNAYDARKVVALTIPSYEHELKLIETSCSMVCYTINKRKERIAQFTDVAIFMPGGIGTIDEFMSMIEMKRTGEYKGAILLINVDHYFEFLLIEFDKAKEKGFMSEEERKLFYVVNSVKEAEAFLKVYVPKGTPIIEF